MLYKYPKLSIILNGNPRKEMGPHAEIDISLTLVRFERTTPEQITVALPTVLQGQMGAGRG